MSVDKAPDRLYIDKDDRIHYDSLRTEKWSPFLEKENKDLFILAMALGFKEGVRRELEKREGFIRAEYLKDEDKALIAAIAAREAGNIAVLTDKKATYGIAEEYASGGIKLLKDKVFSGEPGDFAKKLEVEMVEIFDKKVASLLDKK